MATQLRFGIAGLALLLSACAGTTGYTTYVGGYYGGGYYDRNVEFFYAALAPYGIWFDHDRYGRVWYPRHRPARWRPYTRGHWIYTWDHGWFWVSDWAWGWGPFHYGRWAHDRHHGWIWVPGRTWAPAWVFWRHGGGYAAWAPIPPGVRWRPRQGLALDHFRYDRDLPHEHWVAAPNRRFASRNLHRYLLPARESRDIVRRTGSVSYVTPIGDRVFNAGIPLRDAERFVGHRIDPVHLRPTGQTERHHRRPSSGELEVFRPELRRQPERRLEGQGRPRGFREPTREIPAPPIRGDTWYYRGTDRRDRNLGPGRLRDEERRQRLQPQRIEPRQSERFRRQQEDLRRRQLYQRQLYQRQEQQRRDLREQQRRTFEMRRDSDFRRQQKRESIPRYRPSVRERTTPERRSPARQFRPSDRQFRSPDRQLQRRPVAPRQLERRPSRGFDGYRTPSRSIQQRSPAGRSRSPSGTGGRQPRPSRPGLSR